MVTEQADTPTRLQDFGYNWDTAYVVRVREIGFNGVRCGVPFVNGEAKFVAVNPGAPSAYKSERNKRIRSLQDMGYQVYVAGTEPDRTIAMEDTEVEFDPSKDGWAPPDETDAEPEPEPITAEVSPTPIEGPVDWTEDGVMKVTVPPEEVAGQDEPLGELPPVDADSVAANVQPPDLSGPDAPATEVDFTYAMPPMQQLAAAKTAMEAAGADTSGMPGA